MPTISTVELRNGASLTCVVVAVSLSMLLPRFGVLGGFAFHEAVARRAGSLHSSAAFQTAGRAQVTSHVQRTPLVPGCSELGARMASMSSSSSASVPSPSPHSTKQITKIGSGVRELMDKYDGFILDQFGVLHGAAVLRILCTVRS